MKEFSFINLLRDGTDFCEWCEHPCRDEDKYEMLVICIAIQKECMAICRGVNYILGENAASLIKVIIKILEILPENLKPEAEPSDSGNYEIKKEKGQIYTGCSRIFHIAQSIEQTYLTAHYNNNRPDFY